MNTVKLIAAVALCRSGNREVIEMVILTADLKHYVVGINVEKAKGNWCKTRASAMNRGLERLPPWFDLFIRSLYGGNLTFDFPFIRYGWCSSTGRLFVWFNT